MIIRRMLLAITCFSPFMFSWLALADEADPRRPAAIEAKEVPVVPAEIFAKLAQYQSVRGAAFRGFAPDGTGILIGTRFGNSSQLHRVYEPGGRREQITFHDEPVSGGFLPKATDGAILMLMDAGGNENDQIYLLDRQKFATTRLTDGKSRNKLGAVRPDGSQIVVTSNQRNGRDIDLYVADPRQPDSMKLVMQVDKQTWAAHGWSHDGKTLLLNRYVSANESYPALLDVASGQRTDLPSPTKEKAAFGPMAFAADGKSVFLATDANGEFHRLARLDLASKKYTWLTDDIAWDVSAVTVEPTSGDVAFTVNEDGASRLYLLPKGDGPRHELKLPLGIVSGLEFSPDGKRLGFTLAQPDSSPDAYSLKLDDGELTRWTFSEVGGLNPADGVMALEIGHQLGQRQVVEAAALGHVLHVPVAGQVEGVVDRIVAAVELQRQQAEALAQLDVEGRCGLAPGTVQPDLGVAVPVEDVGLHAGPHALGAEVVAHVGKTQSGRDAHGTAGSRQQAGLGHAPAHAQGQHRAGPHARKRQVAAVGVVAEAVAHRAVQRHGALALVAALGMLTRKGDHGGVVAVDGRCGRQAGGAG